MDRLDIARIIILEDRDERAACDLVGDAERADAGDAVPGGGELSQRLAIVRLDIASHRQGELAVAVAKWPDGFGAAEVEVQAIMIVQIIGTLRRAVRRQIGGRGDDDAAAFRSEEHTSELQSLMRRSYAV